MTTPTLAERIAAVHTFPGPYTFKIVGAGSPELERNVREELDAVLPDGAYSVSRRESSGGRYLALTVDVQAPDVATVVALYERFGRIPTITHLF